MSAKDLTAIIADDEPAALKLMRYRLQHAKIPIKIIGEAVSGHEAIDIIKASQPDVAFLDIQMPPPNGLEIAKTLAESNNKTQFVFVTAFDNHAIEAFKVSAADYLLKPIDEEQLDATLQKLFDNAVKSQQIQAIETLLQTMGNKSPAIADNTVKDSSRENCLLVQDGSSNQFLPFEDISFIQMSGDYASIYHSDQRAFVRVSLTSLLSRLPSSTFVQTHRASAVNIKYIKSTLMEAGDLYLVLNDNRKIKISRSRKASVLDLLEQSFKQPARNKPPA
ncbi:MAG: LytTR family DNA-binding domain-containing protein [Pseudomonadales bacterium]|nr:LytTR family DNA-binding domain-containing protein [Porticoccaceae bacterium]MDG2035091.1 LytTR family DNA-binding domain-containing protein [Pseudomonadales bacterium]